MGMSGTARREVAPSGGGSACSPATRKRAACRANSEWVCQAGKIVGAGESPGDDFSPAGSMWAPGEKRRTPWLFLWSGFFIAGGCAGLKRKGRDQLWAPRRGGCAPSRLEKLSFRLGGEGAANIMDGNRVPACLIVDWVARCASPIYAE